MNNSILPPTVNNVNAPNTLGHYELLDCIGRGGMGLVYRARDTRLDRQVAIKCLRTELFEAHYIERFKREALLLAKLNHPNIVQIYDFIEAPDQLALVMELVEGQNLQLHLREHIVPIAQRMRWLTEIAQGLAVAHDAGIIHRDLKAENILINQRQVAKITDLGIAKSQDFNATLTDHIAGSYCSMSPEQAMGEALDFKSDLFSFGILAYQLLCGAHPFGDSNNKLQLMQRIISHPPIAPQKHNPDLPAEVIDLLGQLLSKDPAKRPENTHWVAAQFEKLTSLGWQEHAFGDETQALIQPFTATVTQPSTSANTRTQDHPTFDTRFIAVPATPNVTLGKRIKTLIAANAITLGSITISLVIAAGVAIWQLQPKPPKYVAVLPPKLTTDDMQESQQALVKLAVYDALQQNILTLDNYHLIPSDEVSDANGDIEAIRRATNADELISTDIQCQREVCHISLTRLQSEASDLNSRLRVVQSKTLEVLTDNYLAMASIVYKNTDLMYQQHQGSHYQQLGTEDYTHYLNSYQSYLHSGATPALLTAVEAINNLNTFVEAQTLYREITLDLFYETSDAIYLEKLKHLLTASHQYNNKNIQHLINMFYLANAEKNAATIESTITAIKDIENNAAMILALEAYAQLGQNDYQQAITTYSQLLRLKPSAINHQNIATAYWYAGNLTQAKVHLQEALKKSPNSYKANQINGSIALSNDEPELAIESFEKIVQSNPNSIDLSNLGVAYLLSDNAQQAELSFRSALDMAPESNLALLNLADAETINAKATATATYQTLVDRIDENTKSIDDVKFKTLALAHLKKHAEAINLLKRLEQLDGQNIDTAYTAATVYALAGEKISALVNIKQALKAGLHPRWFNFLWFNSLCTEASFTALFESGASQRCPVITPEQSTSISADE
jgi:serine/threonine protein kinase